MVLLGLITEVYVSAAPYGSGPFGLSSAPMDRLARKSKKHPDTPPVPFYEPASGNVQQLVPYQHQGQGQGGGYLPAEESQYYELAQDRSADGPRSFPTSSSDVDSSGEHFAPYSSSESAEPALIKVCRKQHPEDCTEFTLALPSSPESLAEEEEGGESSRSVFPLNTCVGPGDLIKGVAVFEADNL